MEDNYPKSLEEELDGRSLVICMFCFSMVENEVDAARNFKNILTTTIEKGYRITNVDDSKALKSSSGKDVDNSYKNKLSVTFTKI